MKYAVNCSILFPELPLLHRPEAAKAAGYNAVEFWWPFPTPTPENSEINEFIQAIKNAGVQLVALNFYSGNLAGKDRGVLSDPRRYDHFLRNIAVVKQIGEILGCRMFNAPYGNRLTNIDPGFQDALAKENLAIAAKELQEINGFLMLEPLSGENYPIKKVSQVFDIIASIKNEYQIDNIGLLADLYHLAVNGEDLETLTTCEAKNIHHIQIADFPGRNEPGTGILRFDNYLKNLAKNGYRQWVSLEYNPSKNTQESFKTLPVLP